MKVKKNRNHNRKNELRAFPDLSHGRADNAVHNLTRGQIKRQRSKKLPSGLHQTSQVSSTESVTMVTDWVTPKFP